MKLKTSEDVSGGGNFLSEPGTYHVSVLECREGQTKKGTAIDGLSADLVVHDGTTPNQKDRRFELVLFAPNLSHSDRAQGMDLKKLTAFALAADLVSPADLGNELDVDFAKAKGRQIVLTLAHRESDVENERKRLDLSWADIFHVDDPRVAEVPKGAEYLKLIDPKCRHEAGYFDAAIKRKTSESGSSQGGQQQALDASAL